MPEEIKLPKITLKIVSQKGTCVFGHKVGEEFDVSRGTPEGLCPGVYHSAYPAIFALMVGGRIPWEEDKDTAHVACTDPANPVVVEVRRVAQG